MLYIPGLLANDRIAFPMLGGYVTSSVQVEQKCYDFLIKILIVRHSKAFLSFVTTSTVPGSTLVWVL